MPEPAKQPRPRNRTQATWLSWLLGAYLLFSLMLLGWSGAKLLAIQRLLRGMGSPARLDELEINESTVVLVQALLGLLIVLAFSRWLYGAVARARDAGAREMTFSPGWAVGWFFVPVLNLYRPYQVLFALWRASGTGRGDQGETPVVLRLWWLCWVLRILVELALSWQGRHMTMAGVADLGTNLIQTQLTLLGALLDIPLAATALLLVRHIGAGRARPAAGRAMSRA